MLKVLTEQLEPTKGMVHRHPRLRIGFFAQHHVDALDLNASAVSFMAKTYPGKSDEEYRRALGSFGITGTTGLQQMATLSGGQKSRVAFACLALQNPHILILDEPTNHLDLRAMDALMQALKEFKGGIISIVDDVNLGVLLVSHDTSFLRQVCNSIWVCQDDTIKKFPGTVKDYQKMVISQADASGVVAKQ
jgi:ATP-binding cassette subfamily F protein 3